MIQRLSRTSRPRALRSIPMFRACTNRELRQIDALVDDVIVDAGEVLTREYRREPQSFVIVEGEAEVTLAGRQLARLGPGEFFGEMAFLDQQGRSATVTALTQMHLLVIGPASFATLAAIPPVGRMLLKGMAARLRIANNAFADLEVAAS